MRCSTFSTTVRNLVRRQSIIFYLRHFSSICGIGEDVICVFDQQEKILKHFSPNQLANSFGLFTHSKISQRRFQRSNGRAKLMFFSLKKSLVNLSGQATSCKVLIFEMLSSNVSFWDLINLIQEVGPQSQKMQNKMFFARSILSIHYQFVTLGTLEKRASLLSFERGKKHSY